MIHALLLAVAFLQWTPGYCQMNGTDRSALLDFSKDLKTAAVAAVEAINSKLVPLSKLFNSDCIEPPQECPNCNVTFWLYTRSNPGRPVELSLNEQSQINLDNVKRGIPWKIIIHGYTKSKDEIPNNELRTEYFKKGDYNLISVDYAPLARDKCYLASVNNVPVIANCTAQMIEALVEQGAFKMSDLHVIGFSLGAQIAGRLHEYLVSGKPGRVTGLDPASPLFDGEINAALAQNAADFVDILHTNALMKGKLLATGHVDFYANGGSIQPGCSQQTNESFSTCNHDRAPLYFAESISSEVGFWGVPCESYLKFSSGECDTDENHLVEMGDRTPPTARGVYYFRTNDKPPFALGKVVRA